MPSNTLLEYHSTWHAQETSQYIIGRMNTAKATQHRSIVMSKMTKEDEMRWYELSKKHWRSWGSWFSWGSPVGLSIFILALAGAVWIIAQI